MVELITCNLAALAIAGIFYTWRDKFVKGAHRRRVLRQRVAYMLWTVAHKY